METALVLAPESRLVASLGPTSVAWAGFRLDWTRSGSLAGLGLSELGGRRPTRRPGAWLARASPWRTARLTIIPWHAAWLVFLRVPASLRTTRRSGCGIRALFARVGPRPFLLAAFPFAPLFPAIARAGAAIARAGAIIARGQLDGTITARRDGGSRARCGDDWLTVTWTGAAKLLEDTDRAAPGEHTARPKQRCQHHDQEERLKSHEWHDRTGTLEGQPPG